MPIWPRRSCLIPAVVAALAFLVTGLRCRAAEIWLAGVDPVVRHAMKPAGESDFGELFETGAPWRQASAAVRVFKTSTQYLLKGSDEVLRQMIDDLNRRGVALGFAALMIPRHQACGSNVEGYSAPGTIAAAALRVKRLGGELRYAAMDEPLWYGHRHGGANACRDTIDAVARQLAENVAVLKSVFPRIEIGDIEPFANSVPPDWAAEILQFATAYRAATGVPLAFVHLDLHWSDDWRPFLADLVPRLRGAGIRYGLIYNGDPADETDLAWTRQAEERFELVEQDPALKPDDAILQTWMAHPTHMLPETEPGTMTSLVLRYLRPVTHLAMRRSGATLSGRLSDQADQALPHEAIAISVADAAGASHPTRREITGIAPDNAASALAALRINTECDCSGSGDLTLGSVRYHDSGGASGAPDLLKGIALRGIADGDRLQVPSGRKLLVNSPPFAVTPGAAFTLDAALDATDGMTRAGYLALIFLDHGGKEMRRLKIMLTPSDPPLKQVNTDADGRFQLTLDRAPRGDVTFRAAFAGNNQRRSAVATAR